MHMRGNVIRTHADIYHPSSRRRLLFWTWWASGRFFSCFALFSSFVSAGNGQSEHFFLSFILSTSIFGFICPKIKIDFLHFLGWVWADLCKFVPGKHSKSKNLLIFFSFLRRCDLIGRLYFNWKWGAMPYNAHHADLLTLHSIHFWLLLLLLILMNIDFISIYRWMMMIVIVDRFP